MVKSEGHSGAEVDENAGRAEGSPVRENQGHSEDGESLESLINKTPFRIVFKGTPSTRTTSVSYKELKASVLKTTALYNVELKTLRERSKLPSAYSFCVDDANAVTEDTKLGDFITLSESNVTALKTAKSDSVVVLTANYTSKHRRPVNVVAPPTLPTVNLDDDSKRAEVEKKVADLLKIDTSGMLAGDGNVFSSHPAELSGHDWNYLMVTNSLLHGFYFDEITGTLQRARFPAFKLKHSFVDPFQSLDRTSSKTNNEGSAKNVPLTPSNAVQSDSDPFHIPSFEVTDDSSVTITEIKTSVQLSMAKHAFSSTSVEASLSGGIGSFSASASASYDSSSSSSSASNTGTSVDCLHASYNFPRVTVFLDSDDLEILDDCKNLLNKIQQGKSLADVAIFHKKYGHIFTRCVQLGGRLHATRDSSAFTLATASAKKDSLKVAAGLSFSSMFVSGSVSASHGNTGDETHNSSTNTSSSSLTWEAQGGETTLSTCPPAWIKTVGSFYNWRVVERSDICNILTVINDILPVVEYPSIFHSSTLSISEDTDHIPLVFVGRSPDPQKIFIKNDGNITVHVAISNVTPNSDSGFFLLIPGSSRTWTRDRKESVYINGGGSGRVAVAIAGPGSYSIRDISYIDTNIDYIKSPVSNQIGITNNLDTGIQVKITTSSGAPTEFFQVEPGQTGRRDRTTLETIFIKHSNSNAVYAYLGMPGEDIRVNKRGNALDGGQEPGPADEGIWVRNDLSFVINVKVSGSIDPNVADPFYPLNVSEQRKWTRKAGPEVIYVSGSVGTAVRTYYGATNTKRIINNPI